jgi:hypothetical protein
MTDAYVAAIREMRNTCMFLAETPKEKREI